jgi:hypothetical protein
MCTISYNSLQKGKSGKIRMQNKKKNENERLSLSKREAYVQKRMYVCEESVYANKTNQKKNCVVGWFALPVNLGRAPPRTSPSTTENTR